MGIDDSNRTWSFFPIEMIEMDIWGISSPFSDTPIRFPGVLIFPCRQIHQSIRTWESDINLFPIIMLHVWICLPTFAQQITQM